MSNQCQNPEANIEETYSQWRMTDPELRRWAVEEVFRKEKIEGREILPLATMIYRFVKYGEDGAPPATDAAFFMRLDRLEHKMAEVTGPNGDRVSVIQNRVGDAEDWAQNALRRLDEIEGRAILAREGLVMERRAADDVVEDVEIGGRVRYWWRQNGKDMGPLPAKALGVHPLSLGVINLELVLPPECETPCYSYVPHRNARSLDSPRWWSL